MASTRAVGGRYRERRWLIALPIGLMAMLGCGQSVEDPFARAQVKGTVTFDGQPLSYGEVSFRTAGESKDVHIAQATVPVRNGAFATTTSQRPGVGPNQVTVTVYSGDPPGVPAGDEGEVDLPEPDVRGYWIKELDVTDESEVKLDIKKSELKKSLQDE